MSILTSHGAPLASQAPTLPLGAAGLPQAFERFIRSADGAQLAFDALTRRVDALKAELHETNRRLREKVEELDHLNSHLVSLLDSLADGVVAFDASATIRLCNPAAERLLGCRASELAGKHSSSWFPQESAIQKLVQNAIAGGPQALRSKAKLPRSGKPPLPVAAAVSGVRDRHGLIIGAVLVLTDLEELTELQTQVQQSARLAAIGRMAAVVAHEIRNPLGGVEGFASLLQTDLAKQPVPKRYADMIVSGVRDLDRLVESLLNFSREPQLELDSVELKGALLEWSALILADARNRQTSLKTRFECQAPATTLVADRAALKQVFLNLMKNAAEAMAPAGGELRIRLSERAAGDRRMLCIEIADTGPGIPPAIREKIFEPFVTTKPKGTGLGLPTVARIVQAHNGSVCCREEPGGGACFEVQLPFEAES